MRDAWGRGINHSLMNSRAMLTAFGVDRISGAMDDIAVRVLLRDEANAIWGFSEAKILQRTTTGGKRQSQTQRS